MLDSVLWQTRPFVARLSPSTAKNMELRHLRYFVAAAEEEHFGRAAQRLHVTRPAVSKLIADLEGEIGARLFARSAHGVTLTNAGRALLPHLQNIIAELNEAFLTARHVAEGKVGSLSIGYGSLTLMHPLFRAAVKTFREACPNVLLSLFEAPSFDHPKALAKGTLDAAFMHFGPRDVVLHNKGRRREATQDEAVLDWRRIETYGLGVALPADHALASRLTIEIAELRSEPFIVVPKASRSPTSGAASALFRKAGFEPHIVQEAQTVTSQLNLVSVGMGVALMPVGSNIVYPPTVTVVPIEKAGCSTSFIFGWVSGRMTPPLERMIAIIEDLSATAGRTTPTART